MKLGIRPAPSIVMVLLGALAMLAVGSGLVGCNKDVSDRDLVTIETPAVKRLVDSSKPGSIRIVDARGPAEFAQGHLPLAKNMTLADMPEGSRLPPWIEPAKTVVVYGQHPGSALARGLAKRLVLAGHSGVKVYEGGFEAWTLAGYTVETQAP